MQCKRTIGIPFRARAGRTRPRILLLCAAFIMQETPWLFEDALMVLYSRDVLGWGAQALLDWKAAFWLVITTGQFLLFPGLSRLLPVMLGINQSHITPYKALCLS